MAAETVQNKPDDNLDKGQGRVLDQEEVDNLIDGIKTSNDKEGLTALIQSSVISHERLPLLEVVFDRLVRLLSTSLRNFTSDNVDISLLEMTSSRFNDYLDSIQLPSLINVIKIKQWDSSALMLLDNSLIYTVVDVLLGGRREQNIQIQNRPYTTIERTLMEEFVHVVLNDLSRSFDPLEKVEFSYDRMETNPRFAMIERPSNAGIIVRLKIELDERGGIIEYFIPYSSLEPVRDKLLQMFVGEKFGNDKIWENHLANEVWYTTIQAEAILDQITVQLSDVLKWKKGSFLPLETYEGAPVILRCGNRELFSGKVGKIRKHVAIQIEKNFLTRDQK